MGVNHAAIPVRLAGAGWSSVNDMLRYVAMELDLGRLPDGERYIGEAALVERRQPKVPGSEDHHYGMGLMVDEYYGTPVVDGVTTFDFGEWRSEVGSRENPDGTTSFMTLVDDHSARHDRAGIRGR